MAVNNTQGILLAVFGASAGGHLGDLESIATTSGNAGLASTLNGTVGFLLGVDLSDDADYVTHVLGNLGIEEGTDGYTLAESYFTTNLTAGSSRGELVASAVDYLLGDSVDDSLAAVASSFVSTVEDAVEWSNGDGASVLGVAELRAQQSNETDPVEETPASGGSFTLTESTPTASYASASAGVTVTLDGDDDADDGTEFTVTGSDGDDTFVVDQFLSVDIDGGDGTDTVDLTELGSSSVVNLLTQLSKLNGSSTTNATLDSIEVVRVSDNADNVVGSVGADIIEGADEDIFGSNTINSSANVLNGGAGTDTLRFTADEVDLSASSSGTIKNIEVIEMANGDGSDAVTLTVATTGASGIVGAELSVGGTSGFVTGTFKGSEIATDTLKVEASSAVTIELEKINFDSIEVLEIAPTATATGLQLNVDDGGFGSVMTVTQTSISGSQTTGAASQAMVINADLGAGKTLDLSDVTLKGVKSISVEGTEAGQTIILGQDQIDAMLLFNSTVISAASAGAFTDKTDDDGRDTLAFAGSSIDLSGAAAIAVEQLSFGEATRLNLKSVESYTGTGLDRILGSDGDDTLVLTETVTTNTTLDLTGLDIDGVETISINDEGGSVTLISLDANVVNDLETLNLNGDINIVAAEAIDVTGLAVNSAADITGIITANQAFVDNFKTMGETGTLQLRMDGNTLDLSGVTKADSGLTVKGTSKADTVTGISDAAPTNAAKYQLASGDDSFTASSKAAEEVINGGAGEDTIDAGAGADLIIGGAEVDTLTGGAGADVFRFDALGDFGDTITDFADGDFILINSTIADSTAVFTNNTLSSNPTTTTAGLGLLALNTATAAGTSVTSISVMTTSASVTAGVVTSFSDTKVVDADKFLALSTLTDDALQSQVTVAAAGFYFLYDTDDGTLALAYISNTGTTATIWR